MEKLTLTPQHSEIIVNSGSLDGAVDLFSYGPESEEALRPFGTLSIVGHRDSDSGNMGYIISLIASLARREYYAQSSVNPREAFGRMLKKVNEIVDEFFTSSNVDLNVGIFAIAGSSIMVSKLDKFKIILARDGQTIDILNNVALFTKEHVQKRRFSSIISGSVHTGDRILAYYPTKPMTSRERYLKAYLTKLSPDEFAAKLDEMGRQHPTFSAAVLCVNMVESSVPATMPPIRPPDLSSPAPQTAGYAWMPRQSPATTATPASSKPHVEEINSNYEEEPEVPHIISTEFALGIRRNPLSKLLDRIRFVRLDTRGKALFLTCTALVVVAGVLVAKSVLFADPQQQKVHQTVEEVRSDVVLAQSKIAQNAPGEARQILMRALGALTASDMQTDRDARALKASLLQTMDSLDNAETGTLSLVAQVDPKIDQLVLTSWSSASQSLWAVVQQDGTLQVATIADGIANDRVTLEPMQVSFLVPFSSGVLVIDISAKKIVRVVDGHTKTFSIPTQDTLLSVSAYGGNLYLLTDHAILKMTDLDTDKPVTKQWLNDVADLSTGAAQIYVDGSVWTLGSDGMLSLYYKGKRTTQTQVALEPSGNWRLLSTSMDGQLAVANIDTKRIYILDTKTGNMIRTIKVDTQQSIPQFISGPDESILFLSKDNKIWKVE